MTDVVLTEIVMPGLIEPDGLIVRERSVPTPGDGEALVEVEASGVSFAETSMRRGRMGSIPPRPRPWSATGSLPGRCCTAGPP